MLIVELINRLLLVQRVIGQLLVLQLVLLVNGRTVCGDRVRGRAARVVLRLLLLLLLKARMLLVSLLLVLVLGLVRVVMVLLAVDAGRVMVGRGHGCRLLVVGDRGAGARGLVRVVVPGGLLVVLVLVLPGHGGGGRVVVVQHAERVVDYAVVVSAGCRSSGRASRLLLLDHELARLACNRGLACRAARQRDWRSDYGCGRCCSGSGRGNLARLASGRNSLLLLMLILLLLVLLVLLLALVMMVVIRGGRVGAGRRRRILLGGQVSQNAIYG